MTRDELIQHYKDIRKKLFEPPGAVYDPGIDLTRKSTGYKGDIPPPGTPSKKSLKPTKIYDEIAIPINFSDVIESVAKFYGISTRDIRGRRHLAPLVKARRVIVHLAIKLLKFRTLSSIGRAMDRDHTTIVHHRKKMIYLLEIDPALKEQVLLIEESILADHCHRSAATAISQPPLEVDSGQGYQVQGISGVDLGCREPLASAEARQCAEVD